MLFLELVIHVHIFHEFYYFIIILLVIYVQSIYYFQVELPTYDEAMGMK